MSLISELLQDDTCAYALLGYLAWRYLSEPVCNMILSSHAWQVVARFF